MNRHRLLGHRSVIFGITIPPSGILKIVDRCTPSRVYNDPLSRMAEDNVSD